MNGNSGKHESRIVFDKSIGGDWRDWGTGGANHGVVCQDIIMTTMPVEEDVMQVPTVIAITGTTSYGGAYNDEWDLIVGEEVNGRPVWERSEAIWDTIFFDGSRWTLRYNGYNTPAYVCDQNTELPPKHGWREERESGGAPTLHYESEAQVVSAAQVVSEA